jgi:hypothetical protein
MYRRPKDATEFSTWYTFLIFIISYLPLIHSFWDQAGLVIHSRQPEHEKEVFETNITGTMNVMKAAKIRKYVLRPLRIVQVC